MEPPGPDVPDPRQGAPALSPLRLAAALAAATLALTGQGHVLLLGLLVGVVVASRAGAVASVLATGTALLRWGSPSLTAVAGGQAVLGPAILVGSTASAASAWLAAAALCAATPRLRGGDELVVAVAAGVAAGAVAAGPTIADDPAVRVAGAVVAVAVALVLGRLRYPRALAAVLGVGAVGLAALG